MAFKINTNGYKSYATALRAAKRRLNWASAYYLTELAIKTRKEQEANVVKGMTIRAKRFVKGRFRVDMARGRAPINQQIARAGSMATDRFSGWKEQEDGGVKKKIATTVARTGKARTGKMVGRARLKKGNTFLTPYSVHIPNAKDDRHRTIIFLRMMSRKKKEPFVLTGEDGMFPAGVYTLEGRHGKNKWPKPRMLQRFKENAKVKALHWNQKARDTIVRRSNTAALWARMWDKADVTKRKKKFK